MGFNGYQNTHQMMHFLLCDLIFVQACNVNATPIHIHIKMLGFKCVTIVFYGFLNIGAYTHHNERFEM
jgi:hypothetical protein